LVATLQGYTPFEFQQRTIRDHFREVEELKKWAAGVGAVDLELIRN
jgi:hypothetical protein